MSRSRQFLVAAATGAAILLLAAGCSAPWQTASPAAPAAAAPPVASPSPTATPTSPPPSPSPSPSAAIPLPPSLAVVIIHSEYGTLTVSTQTGASCVARAVLPNNRTAPGLAGNRVAGSSAEVSWNYPQPTTETGVGEHFVSCTLGRLSGSDSSPFQVGA